MAAEAERVRDADLDLLLPRLVRDVVEVARRIGRRLVDRRRQDPALEREDREDRLDRAGGAEAVAGRALRRGDRRAIRLVLAERHLEHARLAGVAGRRRGAVRVDVADVLRLDAGVGERHRQRPGRVLAGRVGVGDVVRVGRDAVAEQLGVDLRPARLRVLELLDHDHPGRLAHHEAVALAVERPRAALGIVVAPRDRAHRAEPGDADASSPAPRCRRRSSRRRGRAGSRPSRRRSPCSRRRTPCTARAAGPRVPSSIETQPAARFGMIWTIENGLTRSGPRSLSWLTHCLERLQAADAGRDRRADAVGDRRDLEAGVGLGLPRGGEREVREPVHPARRLVVDVVRDLEVAHLAGEVHRVARSCRTA